MATIRIVPQADHDGLVTFAEGLDAVREGYLDRAEAEAFVNAPRERLIDRERRVQVISHFGLSPRVGCGGVLVHAHRNRSEEYYDQDAGSYANQVTYAYLVYDIAAGFLRGLLLGPISGREYPSNDRLGFGPALESAVGTDLLARPDAVRLAIIGSGRAARNHLVALGLVRDWETVAVHSPTSANREAFADEMSDLVDAPITTAARTDDAIAGADVVLCATSADVPVFDGGLLEPGQHVTSIVGGDEKAIRAGLSSIRRRELDDTTVETADVYVANSTAQARKDGQGDFVHPIESGVLDWDDVVSLPDVVAGRHPGRAGPEEVTVYKQNAMQATTHMALASLVWDRVEVRDAGVTLDV